MTEPYYLDNPPAIGARGLPAPWGYLPCGCVHDGKGGHLSHRRRRA